ncbi:MAG: pitrilysin family protein [Bryobacterales bacterium]|nr:pitrilysin family protein [Bryobacterales bacterium]MDE0296493.1 pitrilysin family protein [Bryobacterales bacterium]MDE0433866.1 pitrilysin family protein [Bryobacterales bacterium]
MSLLHRRLLTSICLLCAALIALSGPGAQAQEVEAQVHVLDNGMQFLLLPREGDPNVSAGWVAKVGSVNERPGLTGVAHLFEHMMFKGTHTIGTKDIDRDLEIISQLDALRAQIRDEEETLIEQHRRGLIDNPKDPASRSEEHNRLLGEFGRLLTEQRELIIKDQFDRIYTLQGASGLNAFTSHDLTLYMINVPANKLELWFWMESDRLSNPVFREFYSERDVVQEERRLRVESRPTGKLDEQFETIFWQSSPYHWPVIGWQSDLDGLTRDEALEFFGTYYAPNNLTVALVGDFDPEQAVAWAEKYFGRLKRGEGEPEPVRTWEIEQQAETRMTGYADTRPTVRVRYHTVADAHREEPALLVLSSLLNGRTGRLYKSLVLEQKIATNAGAAVNGLKYDGYFELSGIAAEGHTPEDVEQALYQEMKVLQEQLAGERELRKVKNQQLASDFRRLRSKTNLMIQLLIYEALGDWENINKFSERIQAVTAEDVRTVAGKYFKPENRNVSIYYTKEGASGRRGRGGPRPGGRPGPGGGR